jgi:hypothetical protein
LLSKDVRCFGGLAPSEGAMKKGVKRDIMFVCTLLAVGAVSAALSWSIAYLYVGPPPANRPAREHYAEAIKLLFGAVLTTGTLIVAVTYFLRMVWPRSGRESAKDGDRPDGSDVAFEESAPAEDSTLPPWVGWGILLGFVLIMAVVLLSKALSRD